MRATILGFCLFLTASPAAANPVKTAEQMVVVVTPEWKAAQGEMRLYERRKGHWVQHGKSIPIVVGRKGMAWGIGIMAAGEGNTKDEGDEKAPAGLFSIPMVFGAEPMKTGMPFRLLQPGMTCVDDPQSKAYNRIVDAGHPRDWKSGEDLSALYAFGLVVGHNIRYRERRRGSCIFLHPWRSASAGTLGCTGVEEGALRNVISWLSAAKNPLMVQLPAPLYQEYQPIWGFPPWSP